MFFKLSFQYNAIQMYVFGMDKKKKLCDELGMDWAFAVEVKNI